ncbi:MAG: hypothetical protein AABZ30_09700 [Myxococcota bacterium]
MVRVCASCKGSYSGGAECPECGPGHPLVEACDPAARELMDRRGWAGIRALYGARRAMLMALGGFLVGPAIALLLMRRSLSATHAIDRWLWIGIALAAGATVMALALLRGAKVARRNRRGYDLPE